MVVKAVWKLAYKQVLVSICQRSIASKALKGFCWFLFIFGGPCLYFINREDRRYTKKTTYARAYIIFILILFWQSGKVTKWNYHPFPRYACDQAATSPRYAPNVVISRDIKSWGRRRLYGILSCPLSGPSVLCRAAVPPPPSLPPEQACSSMLSNPQNQRHLPFGHLPFCHF